jgi:hypothetical protein
MNKEELIKELHKALDSRTNIYSSHVGLTITSNAIHLAMFDSRLHAGENNRKVAVYQDPSDEKPFVEKTLTVFNKGIRREYSYRKDPLDIILDPIEKVIIDIKQDLPHLVDTFAKQIEKNNKYVNPKLEDFLGDSSTEHK